jgi:hypothetical protein
MATSYESGAAVRGANAKIRLLSGGMPKDIIAAEEIDVEFITAEIDTQVLAVGQTKRDLYYDGVNVTVKGVKVGNALLSEIKAAAIATATNGTAANHYTAIITYYEVNTGNNAKLKVTNAILKPATFSSGGMNAKMTEGFTITGTPG